MPDTTGETIRELPQVHLAKIVSQAELEACGRMAYRVAHELGNVAAAVVGNADLIARGCDEASPVRRRVSNIVRAMGQASELARHMVLFLGQPSRDDQPLDVRALVSGPELDALLGGLPRPVPVVVESLGSDPLPRPFASRDRIRVALAALLANAGDALVDRSGRAVVRTGCTTLDEAALVPLLCSPRTQPGPHVFLSVEDEGEGIGAVTLPHVFCPAFSTRMRQAGCGLADTFGIICRQHGGGIGLWTEPGRGTRVTLYIAAERSRPASL